MSEISIKDTSNQNENRRFLIDLMRAFGGAILFSFPMLMTMEMWWLGFYMNGLRLTLFTLLTIPLLVGLSYYDGFEDTATLKEDVRETFIAYTVGFTASAVMLFLFGVIKSGMSADEIIGKFQSKRLPPVSARCSRKVFSAAINRRRRCGKAEAERKLRRTAFFDGGRRDFSFDERCADRRNGFDFLSNDLLAHARACSRYLIDKICFCLCRRVSRTRQSDFSRPIFFERFFALYGRRLCDCSAYQFLYSLDVRKY